MNVEQHLRIGFIVLVVSVALTFLVHPGILDRKYYHHDFLFNYYKASGESFSPDQFIDSVKIADYPPLSSWVFLPFSFNVSTYYLFALILFFLLFGLLLVYLSKQWVTGLFWVACSAPWLFLEGVIAQGVLTFLFMFFLFASTRWRLVLLLLALMTQSFGFWLLAVYWIVETLFSLNWKNIVLGVCGTSFFPSKVDSSVPINKVQELTTDTNLFGFKGLNMTSWVSVFRWFVLFPLLPFGFIGLWRKNKVWFVFSVGVFVFGLVFLYWRVVESVMPLVVLGLGKYYEDSSKRMRLLLIFVAIGLFIIQLVNYLNVLNTVHLSLTTLFFNLPCELGWLK